MKHILLITIGLILFTSISVAQDLDLNKTNVRLKNNEKKSPKIDTITRRKEIKINYSYINGLDFVREYRDALDFVNYTDQSKFGTLSFSLHYKIKKWKYGFGINYTNYKSSLNYYDYNLLSHEGSLTENIITPLLSIDRYLNKNFYFGFHIGCNLNRMKYSEDSNNNHSTSFLPYTKICIGYQFKLSNRLNFNLELGAGGSMTNTGVSYLVK